MSPARPPTRPNPGPGPRAVPNPQPAEDLAVPMDETQFTPGGLPTDFDGECIEARAVVWNYDNGNGPMLDDQQQPVFTLAVKATIRSDEGGDDITTYWSAGDPRNFLPSMDGRNPAPFDETGCSEGIMFIRQGSKSTLNNNTNWAQFLMTLKEAEAQNPQLARPRSADVRFLEGLYGHWDRIPQIKRSGLVTREGQDTNRQREILACTMVKAKVAGKPVAPAAAPRATSAGFVPPAAAPKAPAPQAPPTPAAAPTPAAFDEQLLALAAEYLVANYDGQNGIPKGKLAEAVLKAPGLTPPQKAKMVPRITSNEFLAAAMEQSWLLYDPDSGQVWPATAA